MSTLLKADLTNLLENILKQHPALPSEKRKEISDALKLLKRKEPDGEETVIIEDKPENIRLVEALVVRLVRKLGLDHPPVAQGFKPKSR